MDLICRKSVAKGRIAVPGSKSHTIRAVSLAMMADGESKISAPLWSGDTRSCVDAARAMGASVRQEEIGGVDTIVARGVGAGGLRPPDGSIDLGNSGTSLRILTGLAATCPGRFAFDGDDSLRTRQMAPVLQALEQFGARVGAAAGGKCPLWIHGPILGGKASVEGRSSQFVTALLLAAPLTRDGIELEVLNLNERPYVEITLDWMDFLGIRWEADANLSHFKIPGGQRYRPFERTIPADFSTATFPLCAAAITRGEVEILNLDFADRQGDKAVFDYFGRMGASIERKSASVVVRGAPLKGADLDLNATPDALPAMAVAACLAEGRTVLGNCPQARIKETDRIACMTRELRKMGARVEELPDGLVIHGGPLRGAVVESHGDHRIAMALALAGMTADGDTVIRGAECAAVTYPAFVQDFQSLGADFAESTASHSK